MYDASIGRFTGVDPLAADFASWSTYNYVLGNPIRLVDTDGKSPTEPIPDKVTFTTSLKYIKGAGRSHIIQSVTSKITTDYYETKDGAFVETTTSSVTRTHTTTVVEGEGNVLAKIVTSETVRHSASWTKHKVAGTFGGERGSEKMPLLKTIDSGQSSYTEESGNVGPTILGRASVLKGILKKDSNFDPFGADAQIGTGSSITGVVTGLILKTPGPAFGVILGNLYRAVGDHTGASFDIKPPSKIVVHEKIDTSKQLER